MMMNKPLREKRSRPWRRWMSCRELNISEPKVGRFVPAEAHIKHADTPSLAFVQANPPETAQTDISLSQFLAIQEKGVSAWEFEPELEIANCFVEARTEIEFFDSECSVQSNLPVPKQNEVYYWEAKIYDKPDSSTISIGMTTKPYPLFRLPGRQGSKPPCLGDGLTPSRIPQIIHCLCFIWTPALQSTFHSSYLRSPVRSRRRYRRRLPTSERDDLFHA